MIKIKKSPRALLWMLIADFCTFQLHKASPRSEKFRPRFAGWEGCFSLKRLLFLFFILTSSQCHAATYYFSTTGNNTTGNGTQAAPYYSLCGPWSNAGCQTGENRLALGQIPINPGDQFLFKRGEEWVGIDATWSLNAAGAANNPLVFGAWGDPNHPRPIFRGAKTAFELGRDNWTNVPGTSIWYTTNITWWPNMAAQEETAPGGPSLYGAWSVQGVTNANGWTSNQSMVRGTQFYESSTQRLYVWRTDNLKPDHAAGRDIYIGGAPFDGTNRLVKVNRGWAGTSTDPRFVGGHYEFRDLHVKMSAGYGFSTSYPNTTYINCLSELNAMEGFLFDASRFGAPAPGASNGLLRESVARRNNISQGSGIGQGITVESPNVTIERTQSYENAWAGIDFLEYNAKTNTSGGKVIDCDVHHNGIQPVSFANYDPNIYIDGGRDITIQNTRVWAAGIDPRGIKTRLRPNSGIAIGAEPPAVSLGKNVTNIKILNTLSYGNAGEALKISSLDGADVISNVQVIGSTLHRSTGDNDIKGYYDQNYADAGIRVVYFKDMTDGFKFKNNIVVAENTVRAPIFGLDVAPGAPKTEADFDNNLYYCPGCNFNTTGNFSSGGFYSYNYITNATFDQWRNLAAAAGFQQDAALSKTVILSNPMLVNTALSAFDARLLNGSPAFDAADTSVFVLPVSGSTRPDGSADNPYNDLGYHYPITGPPIDPVLDTQAPTAPTSLTAAQLGGQVFLTWAAASDDTGVTGYNIFDGATQLGTSTTLGYTHNAPVTDQTYQYIVKARDAAGNVSGPSNTASLLITSTADTVAPSAPSSLTATLSGTQVTLNWGASTDAVGVTLYEIQHNGSAIGTSTSNAFVHNGSAGATYNYTVVARDAAGNHSSPSSIVTVTIPQPTTSGPTAPTNLAASIVGTQVQLTWSPSTGHMGYNIYRNNSYLKTVGTTSSFDNGVSAGTTYTYHVKSFDGSNTKSAASNTATVTMGGTAQDTQAPSVPANVTASLLTDRISVGWAASTDNVAVTLYKIFNGAAQLATSTTTQYVLTPVSAGSNYLFAVQGCDAAGNCSAQSAAVPVVVTDTLAPSIPLNLTATVNGLMIDLAWSASTDDTSVAGYQVFQSTALAGTSVSTAYSFGPVVSGQTYTFTIKAFDAAGNTSAAGNVAVVPVPDTTVPSVPSGLTAVLSGSQVALSWTAATDNIAVSGYQVFQGTSRIATVPGTTHTVTGLVSGQTHTFTVKAEDAAGNVSAPSSPVTVGTSGPAVPTNLVAYSSGSSIYVGWSTVANASGYAVYRNDAFLRNVTGAGNFYDTAVTAGQTYSYKVQAYDGSSNFSAFSNSMSVTLPLLAAPSNLTGSRSIKKVTLAWGSVPGASGYNIYRNGSYLKSVGLSPTTDNVPSSTLSYRYTVKAYNSTGLKSNASNEVTV